MSRMRLTVIVAALLVFPSVVGAAVEHRVGQKNKTFSVATIIVSPGDRVIFDNDDTLTHNVYSALKGKFSFNLKAQAPGVSTSVTFVNEGNFEVRCAFHPKMRLLVVVKR